MKIDIRSESSLYITMGEWLFYIDNSTGEQIMEAYKLEENDKISKYIKPIENQSFVKDSKKSSKKD